MLSTLLRTALLSFTLITTSTAQALVVLQYHHVSDETPSITSITPERFAEHMAYLAENDFTVLDIQQLPALLESNTLPDKSVVITFDDGYSSIYDHALPVLQQYGFPFTVFVSGEPHDQQLDGYLSWQQLNELQHHRGTLANHTYRHEHLIRLPDTLSIEEKRSRWRETIEKNQQRIEQETGSQHKLFAYPYGEYTPELQALLDEMGYIAFSQTSGPISDSRSLTALPRFPFGGRYTELEDFSIKINTLPFPTMRSQTLDDDHQRLPSPLLPIGVKQPLLEMHFSEPPPSPIQCFASLQGRTDLHQRGKVWLARAKQPFRAGRVRYNCTASAGGGRFYWHSQFFMVRHDDGRWYSEY